MEKKWLNIEHKWDWYLQELFVKKRKNIIKKVDILDVIEGSGFTYHDAKLRFKYILDPRLKNHPDNELELISMIKTQNIGRSYEEISILYNIKYDSIIWWIDEYLKDKKLENMIESEKLLDKEWNDILKSIDNMDTSTLDLDDLLK